MMVSGGIVGVKQFLKGVCNSHICVFLCSQLVHNTAPDPPQIWASNKIEKPIFGGAFLK